VQIFSRRPRAYDGDSIRLFSRVQRDQRWARFFSTVGYPVSILARGGSIQGEVKALNHLLELTVPEISQKAAPGLSGHAVSAMKPT